MNRREALVALNMIGDIGSVRLKRLIAYFGAAQNIFKGSVQKLVSACGISEKTALQISAFNEGDLKNEFLLARKLDIEIITVEDGVYPENLKNIHSAPIVLYVKGKLLKEDQASIAIVGSRRASLYGMSCAEIFAAGLAEKGLTVVSGMARGVDTCAHRGALKAGGRTLAVIGSGFRHMYPSENESLAEEIAQSGAVISEFPMGTKPLPFNFPRRNRIISGLSLGVLVAEAARNSGALITSDFALDQGREVQFIQQELCEKIMRSGASSLEYLQILKGKLGLVAM